MEASDSQAKAVGHTPVVSNILSRFSSVASSFRSNKSVQSSRCFCRICHDVSPTETLMSPCKCTGSVGIVHRDCLEKWLSAANSGKCEICGFKFSVVRKSRPATQWCFARPFTEDNRNLTADAICFMVLTPLAIVSTYLCAAGAAYYIRRDFGKRGKFEAGGLLFLCSFLMLVYLIWLALTVRYHVSAFREWRSENQEIKLAEVVVNSNSRTK